MPPKFSLVVEEEDDCMTVTSKVWEEKITGTICHNPSGMKISPETGISLEGKSYSLKKSDLKMEKRLGQGAGGVVQLATHIPSGDKLAVKQMRVGNDQFKEQVLNEIKGLISAEGCPNLVQLYSGFFEANQVTLALEFMDKGCLSSLKTRMKGAGVPSRMLGCIARQANNGLFFLHSHQRLHRDIKPENILHNSAGQVKLSDFGISKDIDNTNAAAATQVGTNLYFSPERATGDEYSYNSDSWSLGVVIYELATGTNPFSSASKSFPALFQALCEDPEPRLEPSDKFSEPLCDFVKWCLTREVSERKDSQHLREHPLYAPENGASEEEFAGFLATLSD